MKKSELKTFIWIAILILLMDIILMKYWVSAIKPDPFMSLGVESYRLEIFGINVLIGVIVFFIRKKLSVLFIMNSIVSYLIFSFFWNSWLDNHPYSTDAYTFFVQSRQFRMVIEKNPDFFGIDEIISDSKDTVITIGMYEKIDGGFKLSSMQETMYFYRDYLIGFSVNPDSISLKKIE